jgi:hypothetical protein
MSARGRQDDSKDATETAAVPPPPDTGRAFISLLGRPPANVSIEAATAALADAKRELDAAAAAYRSWTVRLRRLFGGGEAEQARLVAAHRRHRSRVELLDRAREDALIARNVERLVAARQDLSAFSIQRQSESWIAAGPSRIG